MVSAESNSEKSVSFGMTTTKTLRSVFLWHASYSERDDKRLSWICILCVTPFSLPQSRTKRREALLCWCAKVELSGTPVTGIIYHLFEKLSKLHDRWISFSENRWTFWMLPKTKIEIVGALMTDEPGGSWIVAWQHYFFILMAKCSM